MSAILYLVSTPIGNLSDLSVRTKRTIEECDLILAEDTRVTLKLLNHLGVKKRMLSCHKFNESQRLTVLEQAAQNKQKVALICDAGTPLVSDPGQKLVEKAIELGFVITPVPGPSAFLVALVGSGLPCERFIFEGFLPDQVKATAERLKKLQNEEKTMVFYVSPHKLVRTLEIFGTTFGDRLACLARELTKVHEEFIRGTISSLLKELKAREIRGEYVLVVKGADDKTEIKTTSPQEIMSLAKEELASGQHINEVATKCARHFGLKKSVVYKLIIDHLNKS